MKTTASITGDWQQGKHMIKVKLSMISFEEDGSCILYCPALDLTGYGVNEKEAYESFKMTLGEYLSYTVNKGTLTKDLKRMGWTVKGRYKKISPPTMQQLLSDNENFSRIFNNHSYRKFDKSFDIPAVA